MKPGLSRRALLRVLTFGALGTAGVVTLADPVHAKAKPKPKPKPKPSAAIGTLSIPKIGLSKSIYQGTEKKTLNRGGFGLWNGTAQPGTMGHSAYFAHRTSAGGPMRKGNLLEPGDAIVVNGVNYTVTAKEIVHRSQWVTGLSNPGGAGGRSLSIVSCSKANGLPTSLQYRLVIRAVG